MQDAINQAVSIKNRPNEVDLFRAMAAALQARTRAILVEETHGGRGQVQYDSQSAKRLVQKEISDLLIVTHLPKSKEVRLNFLQAKFHREKLSPFRSFKGDFFQWELLHCRPVLQSGGARRFPTSILSFTRYKTISSFGVFFRDQAGEIDMLYCIPDMLSPANVKKDPARPSTHFRFRGPCGGSMVLNAGRRNAICPEICCSCEMDHFEASLLQGKIGAPMDTRPILTFVANVCKRAMSVTQSADPNVSVIADILSTVEGEVDLDMTEMPVSRVLFLRASEETGV